MKYLLILGITLSLFSCAKKYTNQECVEKVKKAVGIEDEREDALISFLCEATDNNPNKVLKDLEN